jgi:alpha-beta hydrolase superfamily lysophospholipase
MSISTRRANRTILMSMFAARLVICAVLLLAGCTVAESNVPPGSIADIQRVARTQPMVVPAPAPQEIAADDGVRLPLRSWLPKGEVRATIVALHGMNDYSRGFEDLGTALAWRGIATYAYDQRGFGEAPFRGRWAGRRALAQDLATATRFLKAMHPGLPLYCLGESMGGAVVIVAATGETGAERPLCDGVILSAPAVWGRETQPLIQRAALAAGVRLAPHMVLTGQGIRVKPSDNIAMLRALGRDPLVIKGARVDTIYGLAELMDAALASVGRLDLPTLYLYGNRDELIPKKPTRLALRRLMESPARSRVAWYVNGYHLLLRDLQAAAVWDDVGSWIIAPEAPLPSGADRVAAEVLTASLPAP